MTSRKETLSPKSPLPWRDPVTLATIVVAIATAINVYLTYGLWSVTREAVSIARDSFNQTVRPFVDVGEITIDRDLAQKKLAVRLPLRNSAAVPAIALSADCEVFRNGVEIPGERLMDDPTKTLGPQESVFFQFVAAPQDFDQIMAGGESVEVVITGSYRSLSGTTFNISTKLRYDPKFNVFFQLSNKGE